MVQKILATWEEIRTKLNIRYDEVDVDRVKSSNARHYLGPVIGVVVLRHTCGPFGIFKDSSKFTINIQTCSTPCRLGDAMLNVPKKEDKTWYVIHVNRYDSYTLFNHGLYCDKESDDIPNDKGKFDTIEDALKFICLPPPRSQRRSTPSRRSWMFSMTLRGCSDGRP